MDTLLNNGNFDTERIGLPVQIDGEEELSQRIMIRLRVRRGSLAGDPSLGSRLYTLQSCQFETCPNLQNCVNMHVREALRPLEGLRVNSTNGEALGGNLTVTVVAEYEQRIITEEVDIWA